MWIVEEGLIHQERRNRPLKISHLKPFLFLFLMGSSLDAFAASVSDNDVSKAFCPAIYDKASYAKGDLDHYAMLIPGQNGWIFRTENDFRSDWTNNEEAISQLQIVQAAFKKNNADLVIVMPPVRGLVDADRLSPESNKKYNLSGTDALWTSYEASINELAGRGLHVVGVNKTDDTPDFFYKRNHHWSPVGARLVAAKTANAVKLLPSYKQIPKTEYITEKKSSKPYKSSFEQAFKKICNTDLPDEMAEVYATSPKGTANSSKTLLGEGQEPGIVLVGTSNSVVDASTANFEGFLKEFLSADILNLSIMGGGIEPSIISYINSEHFKSAKPKIVIWEIPGYYYFNEMTQKIFGQLIAGAHGDCSGNSLLQTDVKIKGKESLLFDFQKASTQDIGNSYVHLKFPNPVKENIILKFRYDDNQTKKFQFQRPERYPADGDFYTMIPQKDDASLQKIELTSPDALTGRQVKAQICKI